MELSMQSAVQYFVQSTFILSFIIFPSVKHTERIKTTKSKNKQKNPKDAGHVTWKASHPDAKGSRVRNWSFSRIENKGTVRTFV